MRGRPDDLYSEVPNKLQIVPMGVVVPVDPLTQLVELLRPRALLWKHVVGQGAWAWQMPSDSGVIFGRVVSGSCRFDLPDGGGGELDQGDYVLLNAPSAWILR